MPLQHPNNHCLFPFKHLTALVWVDELLKHYPSANVYVVGGAVRDALRGVPLHDLDLVVTGVLMKDLAEWLQSHGIVKLEGSRFGVFGFIPYANPRNPKIEIALPRTEISTQQDGGYKNFSVQSDPFLPIEEDLRRRDFTVNAMAWEWRTETLIDPCGGEQDLKARIIRAVGDPLARLKEDSTRILRAIRFACALSATIEPKTWHAIETLAPRLAHTDSHGRPLVAHQMVGQELLRMFVADPPRAYELLTFAHVNKVLWDGLPLAVPKTSVTDPTLIFALCGKDTDPPRYDAWLKHWRLAVNRKAIRVALLVHQHGLQKFSSAEIERTFLPHRALLVPFLQETKNARAAERLLSVFRASALPPILTGDDLLAQGFSPGPEFRRLLDTVRSAELDGRPIPSLHQLLAKES
ncbi:CCA tRNA nucleotidyltransferase [Candidatus Uhrbacteria bacterium]|nr:CCA tRNA nucleotidyltransferase [Candidatus Uhrbacteria bacterium]